MTGPRQFPLAWLVNDLNRLLVVDSNASGKLLMEAPLPPCADAAQMEAAADAALAAHGWQRTWSWCALDRGVAAPVEDRLPALI